MNGLENESLLSIYTVSGLTRGKEYSFRYRVKNSIGWSAYSDEISAVAAVVPGKLEMPRLSAVTASTITVALNTNVDDGGSELTEYVLQRNLGSPGSAF